MRTDNPLNVAVKLLSTAVGTPILSLTQVIRSPFDFRIAHYAPQGHTSVLEDYAYLLHNLPNYLWAVWVEG